jgi:hypothetical protein
MRLAQGGKFHHGFLSGFVSSLGGSYMDWKGGDMIGLQKIAISAAIGGTAEALGGGKFANGAVTGAYVMAFNHLGSQFGKKDPDAEHASVYGKDFNDQKAAQRFSARMANKYNKEITINTVTDFEGKTIYSIVPWANDPAITADHGSMGWIEDGCYNGYKLVESEHFSPLKENQITGQPIRIYKGSPSDQNAAYRLGIPIIHNSQRATYTYTPKTLYNDVKPVPFSLD